MKRTLGILALFTVGLATPALAKHEPITMVRVHQEAEVMAPPATVWTFMTTGKNFVTWCPEWKSSRNAAINLTRVGDSVEYTDAWGNGGRSIVTYLVKAKELRVAHEPAKGDYVCQAKFTLTPTAHGTMVRYWDQYSDESAPKDQDATAAKVEAEMTSTLAALKQAVEKK